MISNKNILSYMLLLKLLSLLILNVSLVNGNQHKLNALIRESYNQVSAHIVSYFNDKCNLALQNCLFQTQWDKVFGKEKLKLSTTDDAKSKRSSSDLINNHSHTSFYYCQAFLVAKFCIDDYLKKSTDNVQCVNGTNGNLPNEFKRSIYRKECKTYYAYFFDSSSPAKRRTSKSSILIFLTFLINYSYRST
jgi:hypothetical protein